MSNSFSSLELAPSLQRAVADLGYTSMTPIQAKAIPTVLSGRDVMGAAQTGTGKTAAFSLPLLQKMMQHENASASPARHPVRALVLLPTRELADQVAQSVVDYAKHTQLKVACVFGGVDIKPQAAELKAGVEVLIATPGRLLDHIEARNCVLNQVEYVVLDEADRMLDIGFLPDLQRILSHLPKKRQTLLFSATFSNDIKRLSQSYLSDPEVIEVARANATATNIEQLIYEVGERNKRQALIQLIKEKDISQAIIFANSRAGTARLARALEREGIATAALHGDKTQDERTKALDALKQNKVRLLVATDVAARGLDVVDLPAVFNYDLPFNPEDYVHRIGRTGRAGANGIAISFVEPKQKKLLADIEKLVNKKFTIEQINLSNPESDRRSSSSRNERNDRSESSDRGRNDQRTDRIQRDAPKNNYAISEEERERTSYRERRDSRRRQDDPNVSYANPRNMRYDPLFNRPYDENRAARDAAAREKARASADSSTPFSRYNEQKQGPLAVLLGGDGRTPQ